MGPWLTPEPHRHDLFLNHCDKLFESPPVPRDLECWKGEYTRWMRYGSRINRINT